MVLYMIGLGLGDEDDITLKGLKIIQSADLIFLEAYTSILGGLSNVTMTKERLENVYNITKTSIIVADRNMVEQDADELIIKPAIDKCVAFLVVGDPVCATTHTDLWIRAKQVGVTVTTIHNASIMSAAGSCGLQLYTFGQTISIPYFTDKWKPMQSFYDRIVYNRAGNLHTLCLLDIQVKEPDYTKIIEHGFCSSNNTTTLYLPPRFMSVAVACQQLIETQQTIQGPAYDINTTLCIGLARMGNNNNQYITTTIPNDDKDLTAEQHDSSTTSNNIAVPEQQNQRQSQQIVAGTMTELSNYDLGDPLHSLIICADVLHELEWDMVKHYVLPNSIYQTQRPRIV